MEISIVFSDFIQGLTLIQNEFLMNSGYTTGINDRRALDVKPEWLIKEVKADPKRPHFGGELRCYKTPDGTIILEDASGIGSTTYRYAYR